ncbi:MAG: DUF1772 domain-containing protein [Pyrinomonadaceae bacterium]
MSQKHLSADVVLLLFVIVLGVTIGGGLYETLVVMPLWSAAPPDSVIAFHLHNVANPQFVLDPGGRFWMFTTPLLGLLSLISLLSGFRTDPRHRRWRTVGAGLALIVVICTFVWFVPNIIRLMSGAVTSLSRDEIASLTNWWVRLNWVRAVVYVVAWLAALRALTISPKSGTTN